MGRPPPEELFDFGFAGSLNRFRNFMIAQFTRKIKNQIKSFGLIDLFSAVCVIYSSRNCASRAIFALFRSLPNSFSFSFSFLRPGLIITLRMGFGSFPFAPVRASRCRTFSQIFRSEALHLSKNIQTSLIITKSLQLLFRILPGRDVLYISQKVLHFGSVSTMLRAKRTFLPAF